MFAVRSLLCSLTVLSVCAHARAAPQGTPSDTLADQFARLQDFSTSPPSIDSYLSHLLFYLEPNGSFEHLTGPPFPQPGPFYLFPGLWSYSGPTELYVDAIGPWLVTDLYLCDPAGVGSFVFQPPVDPALRTVELVCQPLGLWLGPCQPGVLSFSSGPALLLQVQ